MIDVKRQTTSSPLFPDMLWSRPENKRLAGKLLIIGGNLHGFSDVVAAYNAADINGIGAQRVLLPTALRKIAGPLLHDGYFTPSTPSGSFARESLAEILEQCLWADGTLLAGNFGRNSETGILLESFVQKNNNLIVITRDAADYYVSFAHVIKNKSNHVLVISFAQLQKLAVGLKWRTAFTFSLNVQQACENLQLLCEEHGFSIVTKFHQQIIASDGTQTIIHSLEEDVESWRLQTAAKASVWVVQNPTQKIPAIACSLI